MKIEKFAKKPFVTVVEFQRNNVNVCKLIAFCANKLHKKYWQFITFEILNQKTSSKRTKLFNA
jgi:hypothetical protein